MSARNQGVAAATHRLRARINQEGRNRQKNRITVIVPMRVRMSHFHILPGPHVRASMRIPARNMYPPRMSALLNSGSGSSVRLSADSTWLMLIIIRKQGAPQSPSRWLRMKYGQVFAAVLSPK